MRLVKHPVLCNYYVTYRCNAKCSFCDIWERPSPYVTLDDFKANLKDLKRLGVRVIDFTGGEPLLHQQLGQMLGLAKAAGLITTVTTNGMLYPKMAKKLQGTIDMLHFSLDAATKATHDAGRGVACFDLVMESIKVAKALGERPDILFTAFADNLDQLAGIYHNICLPNNLVLIINPAFDYNDVATGPPLSNQQLAQLRQWGKKKLVYLNEAFIQLRLNGGNQTSKPVCKAATSTVVISPENQLILPCYHLGQKAFPIKQNLFELYHSAEANAIKAQEGRLPGCQGCTINCYMQPSFAVNLNRYWWHALPSTVKYNRLKGTWQQLLPIS